MKRKLRVLFQLTFLGMVLYVALRPLFDPNYVSDFEQYCPFGGLASFGSKLNQGTMSCNMSEVQLILGLGLLLGIILIGKLFCSYVCPLGAITEWLGKIGDRFKIRMKITEFFDRVLRVLKYALLFFTLWITMTSSELFCKQYDPYFALANFFDNSDIVLYLAIPAVALLILGTIFTRLFWCKYLCPLSAISNVFLNFIPVAIVIAVYILFNWLVMSVSLFWLLLVIVLVGMITEVFFKRSFTFPLAKITRNEESCTFCKLCEKACPQGIKITEYDDIRHTDCNLCTDCVHVCPEKKTLEINGKSWTKYLAPVATVVLIALSLGFASKFEFTTISERWNDFDKVNTIAIYEQTDLKTVKCYGSAMSLKNHLTSLKGIYGLDAYASSHTVKIYYNPTEISEKQIIEILFTPQKIEIRKATGLQIDSIAMFEIGIDNLFDAIDHQNLKLALEQNENIYGFDTYFGEPVIATIFYNPQEIKSEDIKNIINADEITATQNGVAVDLELNFKTTGKGEDKGFISVRDYNIRLFNEFDRPFNKYPEQDIEKLSVLIYPFVEPELDEATINRNLIFLMSHLSNNKGIFRITRRYIEQPTMFVYFNSAITSLEQVQRDLTSPKLIVTYRDGSKEEIDNPFRSQPVGDVKPANELDFE
ncbi:MAG: 4Fe-4S binding protein [Ignavibacteriales bacterium]|nr:4Fe-4S binding protein [Ignavibacteriales bacterium]